MLRSKELLAEQTEGPLTFNNPRAYSQRQEQ